MVGVSDLSIEVRVYTFPCERTAIAVGELPRGDTMVARVEVDD